MRCVVAFDLFEWSVSVAREPLEGVAAEALQVPNRGGAIFDPPAEDRAEFVEYARRTLRQLWPQLSR